MAYSRGNAFNRWQRASSGKCLYPFQNEAALHGFPDEHSDGNGHKEGRHSQAQGRRAPADVVGLEGVRQVAREHDRDRLARKDERLPQAAPARDPSHPCRAGQMITVTALPQQRSPPADAVCPGYVCQITSRAAVTALSMRMEACGRLRHKVLSYTGISAEDSDSALPSHRMAMNAKLCKPHKAVTSIGLQQPLVQHVLIGAACHSMGLRQYLTRSGGSRSDTRDTDMVRCSDPPTAATMTAASSMPKLDAMPCASKLLLSA